MARDVTSKERNGYVVSRPPSFQLESGEASLARLQQMSELTGFQLAAAFSANGYNRYAGLQVGASPVVFGYSQSLPPPELGRERWPYWNRPPQQCIRPSWNQQAHHFQVSQAQEALKAWSSVQQQQQQKALKAQQCQVQQLPACQIRFQQPPSRPSVVRHVSTVPCADLSLTLGTGTTSTTSTPATTSTTATTTASSTSSSTSTNNSTAQFTMFYGGKIFVYDNMPANKAQAIMLLAGSIAAGSSDPIAIATLELLLSAATPSPPAGDSAVISQPAGVLPQARKASLARFLERRKERSSLAAPYTLKMTCVSPTDDNATKGGKEE